MRVAVALLLVVGLQAADTVDLTSDSLIEEGSAQFAKSCAVGYCHGSEGRSARGPALRDRVGSERAVSHHGRGPARHKHAGLEGRALRGCGLGGHRVCHEPVQRASDRRGSHC